MATRILQGLDGPGTKIPIRQYGSLLRKYLREQKGIVALASALVLTNVGLQLVNPQILRYFIDEALAGSPLGKLLMAAVVFVAVALVQQVIGVLATYTSSQVGWNATNTLRSDLARHALSLDMPYHNNRTPGEMIERIDGDAQTLGGFFSTFVVHIVGSAVLMVGIFVFLFLEEWRAGLALTAFGVLTLLILSRLRNIAVPHWQATREASAETYGFMEERLSGREDIRTSAAKPYVVTRFYEIMRAWLGKELKASLMTSIVFNASWFMFGIGRALALGIGAYLFLQDEITLGTVYLIFHYMGLLERPINVFTRQLDVLQRATASILRILELLHTKRTVLDGHSAVKTGGAPSIRFERVSFAYKEGEPVLRDISFEVAPRRVLGLLGRTGTGKTTIVRLLFRLYDPEVGRVLLNDQDIREARISDLRESIAMVTQDVRLLHGSVRDNLTFFDSGVPDECLLDIIQDLGLMGWYRKQPHGLDTEIRPSAGGLSSGEAQLLAFARVLLKDPDVVILDEATSRLDRRTEYYLEHAIDRLLEGRTAVIVAHHLATLERCDEIMVLENAHVAEYGTRESLAANPMSQYHSLLRKSTQEMPE